MNRINPDWKQLNIRNCVPAIALSLSLLNPLSIGAAMAQEFAPTPNPLVRTLAVTGRGVETIPTTIAQVNLGVEVQGKTVAEVQQEAARRSAAVVELLRSRHVEKLQTTGIRLNPNYSYEGNVQRLIGYTAVNTVSFRLDPQRVGNLLDEAVNVGATRIDGINFVASDNAIAQAQQQALRQATQDAQRQADTVLSALNLTRRDVVGIQINQAFAPPPRPLPMAEAASANFAARVATPVIGGEQQVEASVTLQIRY